MHLFGVSTSNATGIFPPFLDPMGALITSITPNTLSPATMLGIEGSSNLFPSMKSLTLSQQQHVTKVDYDGTSTTSPPQSALLSAHFPTGLHPWTTTPVTSVSSVSSDVVEGENNGGSVRKETLKIIDTSVDSSSSSSSSSSTSSIHNNLNDLMSRARNDIALMTRQLTFGIMSTIAFEPNYVVFPVVEVASVEGKDCSA